MANNNRNNSVVINGIKYNIKYMGHHITNLFLRRSIWDPRQSGHFCVLGIQRERVTGVWAAAPHTSPQLWGADGIVNICFLLSSCLFVLCY